VPAATIFRTYLRELRANLTAGNATELTHRGVLEKLLEEIVSGVTATHEPQRIACGAPDYVVSRVASEGASTPQPVGYVEAKDCDIDLYAIERDSERSNPRTRDGKQLRRYRSALSNLLLTNYLEFRWYLDGEPRQVVRLADLDGDQLVPAKGGTDALPGLLEFFLIQGPAEVANPQDLARRMARITHMIRDIVVQGFEQNHNSQNVRDLYTASKQTLVPDLAEDTFADMFAQTLAYGLFAARANHQAGPFRWQNAVYEIPQTNPFVRQLFDLFVGPSMTVEPFASFVDDLAQLLDAAQMDLVLADFGKRDARQDPIMHFYETFLEAYDPALKKSAGVFYTPEPVISWIVRSVDHLLQERFGCADGLADYSKARYVNNAGQEQEKHRVLVLDPACGTGSFLYAVIDHIREHYRSTGQGGMWRAYVKEHLLPRLFGFELLMAAYAMAHLKLGMQLAALDLPEPGQADWAYPFDTGERLGVYLTNTLEPGEIQAPTMFGPMRELTKEASAAVGVKRDMPIMVVLGNPPYLGSSANASKKDGELTWIGALIEDYKKVDGVHFGERSRNWLQDDYVKFLRFGQWRIQESGAGILGFITNHAYLTNPTFRGMRQQLMDTFTDIYVLDLHGNARHREHAPDGGVDQNVFDIQQGVAVGMFVKEEGRTGPAKVHHADVWGERDGKYAVLAESDITTTKWEELQPDSPTYLFKPWDTKIGRNYEQWSRITEIMPVNSTGVLTSRDKLAVQHTADEMMRVVRDFAVQPTEIARQKYRLPKDGRGWTVDLAQDDLVNTGISDDLIARILYRPFDVRYTYFTGKSQGFIWRPRTEVMKHMISGSNIGLSTTRSLEIQGDFEHVFVSNHIIQHHAVSLKEVNYLFPLYLYPSQEEVEQGSYESDCRLPNISPEFTAELASRVRLKFINDCSGDLQSTFGPEDVFHYIYAILHAPPFRARYAQFLRTDFPRIPPPNDLSQFRALVELGEGLTLAHLLRLPALDANGIGFPIAGDNVVAQGYPKYVGPGERPPRGSEPLQDGRVYIHGGGRLAHGQYFEGIAPDVWEFRIGGYQPLKKWLQDRKGRELTFDDLRHFGRTAAALRETIRLMTELDQVELPFA